MASRRRRPAGAGIIPADPSRALTDKGTVITWWPVGLAEEDPPSEAKGSSRDGNMIGSSPARGFISAGGRRFSLARNIYLRAVEALQDRLARI